MTDPIKVVDLFAGPGGLGEGFSAYTNSANRRAFRIIASAEMDPVACRTLRLRAFYRQFEDRDQVPDAYFDYLAEPESTNLSELFPEQWKAAEEEALQIEIGTDDDAKLDRKLRRFGLPQQDWVLIGGPPCQAYSLVGRARNRGIDNYVPEQDHRHYLYRDYLRIIRDYKPAVFVMENVKGILSSSLNGEAIFGKILSDLMDPGSALGKRRSNQGHGYRLYSLVTGKCRERGEETSQVHPSDFVVRAEEFGIPQRRHRVFILGVREDIPCDEPPILRKWDTKAPKLKSVIGGLPPLRSGLSAKNRSIADTYENWLDAITNQEKRFRVLSNRDSSGDLFGDAISLTAEVAEQTVLKLSQGNSPLPRSAAGLPYETDSSDGPALPGHLEPWLINDRLRETPNHETRSHIMEDLGRYLFTAAFGEATQHSPKATEFPEELAPDHRNWRSGKFADRFRVQLAEGPATTITSHISKDGHYFIHYDPAQCRSLTVREAARIQTFPDDYFFEGPRTQQFHQVGNAVPPFLAKQIAELVSRVLGCGSAN